MLIELLPKIIYKLLYWGNSVYLNEISLFTENNQRFQEFPYHERFLFTKKKVTSIYSNRDSKGFYVQAFLAASEK